MTKTTSPARLRGADLLAEALAAHGIETIFGVPGDTGIAFYDALRARTDRLHHVLARDERHAAVMADAYARVSGQVGTVEVSSGGGTTYVIGGLGEAYASGVPVLVIASDIHRGSRNTGALTEIDELALFSAVTKHRRIVEAVADIPGAVAEALHEASAGRPAPVALILPEDVLDELIEIEPPLATTQTGIEIPERRLLAEADDVARAAGMLNDATRPAILAGSGVHWSRAWEQLAALAERAAVPVATTIHGKGAVPDDHPLSLGVAGNNGAREYANRYLQDADAVLIVGSRANATDTNSWTGPARHGTPVAQIDIDTTRAGRNFPEAIRLAGDAQVVLGQLARLVVEASEATRIARAKAVAAERATWRHRVVAADGHIRAGQLLPANVVRMLNTVFGGGALVFADPGTPTPNLASYWETSVAGRTVIVPRGHGPMGYAIPAAVGAAHAHPGCPILALTADGSFGMACGELETVSRLELPILYVQFTNHSLGWIKMLQHLYMNGRYFGVDPGTIDAVGAANAFGLAAERVTSMDRLEELAKKFIANRKPLYIDIEVPHMIDHLPPVSSWIEASQGKTERPVY